MRYAELLETTDPTDDDLFGPGDNTLGLTVQQCRKIAQVLEFCREHLRTDPEFEDMPRTDPEDWAGIQRDFVRSISAFNRHSPIHGMAALEVGLFQYDLDNWAYQMIEAKAGIDLWQYVDMDDPQVEAAWDRAKDEMGQAHTRFDSALDESDDDELFGSEPGITGKLNRVRAQISQQKFDDYQKFILVAPDDEIIGQGPIDLVSFNELHDMAVAQAPLYMDAEYDLEDEIQILLVTDNDYGQDHEKLIISWTLGELMHGSQVRAEPDDAELFGNNLRDRHLSDRLQAVYGQIHDHGDAGYDFLDGYGSQLLFNRMWSKYQNVNGDVLEAICREATDRQIEQMIQELEEVVDNLESGLNESAEPTDAELFGSDNEHRRSRATQARERIAELVDVLEPEEAYEHVADEMNMDVEDLYNLLDDDSLTESEPDDKELFGSEPALTGAKRLIYNAGRRILHSLEQAWRNPAIQREYNEYREAGDTDAQFDQVVRICKLPFKQVFVVDTVIREFAGMEGLNDYGWMIESGEFNDLVDAWQRFRDDADIEHEDWFQRDARDFTGGLR